MDRAPITARTTITGRSAFLRMLIDEGVDHLFGNPGTTELPVMDALVEYPELNYVLGLQEGVVVGMADGYARATNKLTACNVHVAPGLGNAMGSLYSAKINGSPLIITAGQHEQGHGLTEPMLYDSLVPMAQPLVKWAIEVTRLADLPRIVRRAAKIATTPPTGPVFISLPGDILDDQGSLDLGRPTRVDAATRPSDATVQALASALLQARNPVLIAGHEIATRDAFAQAAELAELLGAPVYQQTVSYGAHYPSEHVAYMGELTRTQAKVRATLEPHDLMLCLGSDVLKMSVHSNIEPLPEQTRVLQISERDWELGKNYPAEIACKADIKETLNALNAALRAQRSAARAAESEQRLRELASKNWSVKRNKLILEVDGLINAKPIDPRYLVRQLSDAIPADTVFVDEGLTSSFSLLSFLRYRDPQSFYGLASGGIGFAVPGAVGISLGIPNRPVVALVGDGSAMYSIQGLWTAAHLKRPITYIIANNSSYRILKERQMARRGNKAFYGMDIRNPAIDFVALAQSMGVRAQRVTDAGQIADVVRGAIASGETNLIDVTVIDGF